MAADDRWDDAIDTASDVIDSVPIADQVSVRAVQFDWVPVRIAGEWFTSNIRLGWGIVFTFD